METLLVCTHVGESTDVPIDVAVELFSGPGTLIPGINVDCGVVPGETVAFRTHGTMAPPYLGISVAIGPQVPLGTTRVLSTDAKNIACDATLIDRSNVADLGLTTATMNVRVTRATKPQQGD